MGLYSKHIFPRFYDHLMDKPFWAKYRNEQLASVDGEILEIGVGTGLNLPHYPPHVRKITTADPNPGMNKRLQRRIPSLLTDFAIRQRFFQLSETFVGDEGIGQHQRLQLGQLAQMRKPVVGHVGDVKVGTCLPGNCGSGF